MAIATMEVSYTYLKQQFDPGNSLAQDIMRDIQDELTRGQFTLGPWVDRFEQAISEKYNVKHCIAVNSGTDALILSLKAMGIGPGHRVLTVPNSFVATVGAIAAVGATPVFVDVENDYQMDIEQATKISVDAAIPVHLTGLAKRHNHWDKTLYDAAQAIGAEYEGTNVGGFPGISAFSLHPLKNLNVWGDAGMVLTDDDDAAATLRLLRNHGLVDRDTVAVLGYNSRLDSLQAIVACHGIKEIDWINEKRIQCANQYDTGLRDCSGVTVPFRDPRAKQVYHTYVLTVENRNQLQQYLAERGIQTKVHYPIPLHLQPACAFLGYKAGDFPVCEAQAEHILSLPNNQYLTDQQINWVIECVRGFYEKSISKSSNNSDPHWNNHPSK